MNEKQLIESCSKHYRKGQNLLYDRYSGLLLAICLRYAGDRSEAEEILQESLTTIFFTIKDYKGKGSFEDWLRNIVVNTAINHFNRNLTNRDSVDMDEYTLPETDELNLDMDLFNPEELFGILNWLPPANRMVFNLYALEGYKHKDIAKRLKIDTINSKSDYSMAKALIRQRLVLLGKRETINSGNG